MIFRTKILKISDILRLKLGKIDTDLLYYVEADKK